MLLWPSARLHAEQAGLTERYAGIRETTVRYIALGTPDDLIRLQDAFYETERELAQLRLDTLDGSAQFANKPQQLKERKDRLAELKDFRQFLDRSNEQISLAQLPLLGAEPLSSTREQLSERIEALGGTVNHDEEAIRSEKAAYIRTLMDERKGLANLLAVRRGELLAEHAKFPDCHAADQTCLRQRLRILCNLKALMSGAERLPILRLIAEVDSRLNAPREPETPICENP